MIPNQNRRRFLQTASTLAAATAWNPGLLCAKPAKPRIKIGQIGVGHAHAAGKMQIYRELDKDYEVVGIVEPDDKLWAAASRQKNYQGLERLTRDQLLNTAGLQAVAVETGVDQLLKHAEACVDAGLHIHLDKPAGTDMAHYRSIMEKADKKKRTVQMGYMYRYNPAVLLLQKFLTRGWLGDVFELHTVMSKVVGAGSRKDLAKFKGGIMLELGCHIIDLAVRVLGRPEKVTPHIRKYGNDGLADNMLAVLDYPGATATVKSSALEVEGFARRHLAVCGTEGTFHIQPLDRPSASISLGRRRQDGDLKFEKGVQEIPFQPPYRRYLGDALDFAKIIRGEKGSDFPSAHDLAVQETVLKASGMME